MNDGGPAFPIPVMIDKDHPRNISTFTGMSMRDYFAAKALVGLTQCENVTWKKGELAKRAYQIADAMLVERAKSTTEERNEPTL